ncbi:type I methionyl aminopeptidase [Ferruginibacter sp. HRS2-29]|uniref:type I methionyl aminopeptidase n=1 Tax=Ferruginibacter sp. HRS2-29 TaxID=2487334 RepID=UPI0020CD8743|nr:type I methionyl aminopeptidase [Ferruginibacter sp. HRS2-29]MCP9750752.1 type I methionyl aminopeptidase [Ferruginibacter sp. HRS2-29]
MIQYKSKEEIEIMRHSCLLVGKAHAEAAKVMKEGMTTMQVNNIVEQFILDNGGTPTFKNYNGFPYATCISMNEAVVHGFPGEHVLKSGDIISLDIGVYKNGFHGDSAYTYAIGEIADEVKQLLRVTKESLYLGIKKARQGNRVGDIANAIQEHTERKHGYGVVRELVGHGVGRNLHEEPQVPNYGKRGTGAKLKEGMVLAIEPMINLGVKEVVHLEDGWTILTKDRKPSAHFEHDVCITKGEPDILSSFEEIEAAEKGNPNLTWSY